MKDMTIQIRVSEVEKYILQREAERLGYSLSDLVRFNSLQFIDSERISRYINEFGQGAT